MKLREANATKVLKKGQIWKLKHVYIQIVELKQKLLLYRMFEALGETGVRIQTSGVDIMWRYLKSRHARLLRNVEMPMPSCVA